MYSVGGVDCDECHYTPKNPAPTLLKQFLPGKNSTQPGDLLQVIKAGKAITGGLGGSAKCLEFTEEIIRKIEQS